MPIPWVEFFKDECNEAISKKNQSYFINNILAVVA